MPFSEKDLDCYLEARDTSVRLAALYDQVRTARSDAKKGKTVTSERSREEPLERYMALATDLAKRLKGIRNRIPTDLYQDILGKVPEQVSKDVLALRR